MGQVLSVPEGAEALWPKVLGAEDRVLLGLEVATAHVVHPLPEQLGAAEREAVGRVRGQKSNPNHPPTRTGLLEEQKHMISRSFSHGTLEGKKPTPSARGAAKMLRLREH